MRRSTFTVALSIVFAGAILLGARNETPVVTPGSSDVTTDHLRNASRNYRYLSRPATGDTSERETGTGRVEEHATTYDGKPAVLLVTMYMGPKSTFVDSALVMRAGLIPVWEQMGTGPRNTRFEYAGKRVKMTITRPDSATRTREHTYDLPVFHFNELDVLLRSLPLREGYEAILPLYSEGSDQLEMDSVRVMSKASNGVWSVRFADPAIVSTYGIDGKTREIVSQEVLGRASGAHSRKVPIQ